MVGKKLFALVLSMMLLAFVMGPVAAQTSNSGGVTIEFAQWWEPELPAGSLRAIMDDFQAQNPGITVKLISGPYSTTHDQIVAGAATGTLSNDAGLDGAWVNDLAKPGASSRSMVSWHPPTSMRAKWRRSSSWAARAICSRSRLSSIRIPSILTCSRLRASRIRRGIALKYAQDAKKLTKPSINQYGWVLPLYLQNPNGAQNDVMSWVWASGKSMLKDGRPDLTNPAVVGTLKYIDSMYKQGLIAPGSFSMQEQDKVEQFVNGRVGMMIDSLAHINMIRSRNPNLNFTISALPAVDGYNGKRGLPYAAWGIGVSANSQHKDAAWKLVEYLMSPEVNSKLVSLAHAFPGNVRAKPDFVSSDAMYAKAFEIFKSGYLANEFVGLPVAEQLMRAFDEEMQMMLDGKESAERAAANAQAKWNKLF